MPMLNDGGDDDHDYNDDHHYEYDDDHSDDNHHNDGDDNYDRFTLSAISATVTPSAFSPSLIFTSAPLMMIIMILMMMMMIMMRMMVMGMRMMYMMSMMLMMLTWYKEGEVPLRNRCKLQSGLESYLPSQPGDYLHDHHDDDGDNDCADDHDYIGDDDDDCDEAEWTGLLPSQSTWSLPS